MTYNPGIPQPNQFISVSQGQILDNFAQLNAQFGVDHTAFNTGSGNGDGFHKKVTYNVPQSVDPTPAGTASVLYTKSVSGVGQLFFANSAGVIPITGTTTIAPTGMAFLPGGIILKWGIIVAAGNNTPVTFTPAFPANCFNVQLTGGITSGTQPTININMTSITRFGFTIKMQNPPSDLFYFAIGV